MKRFLYKLVVFALPLVVLSYPVDLAISHLLNRSHLIVGEFEVWNDIYNGQAGCDLAIYGSSRAWVNFNSQILEDSLGIPVYNFGIDGNNFKPQYLRHLQFFEHNKHPTKIIMSMDIFSLEKQTGLYNYYQFLPYMLWNENFKEYTSSYAETRSIDYFIPLVRYFGKPGVLDICLHTLVGSDTSRFRHKGFAGMKKHWNSDLQNAREKFKHYHAKPDPGLVALFKKFVSQCKASGTQVILVYPPEYIDGQGFVSNRSEIIRLYQQIAGEYNLLFLDYSQDDLSFHKSLFYNSGHLNQSGATKFTNTLVQGLKKNNVFR